MNVNSEDTNNAQNAEEVVISPRPIDWSGPKCPICGFPEHSDDTGSSK